METLTPSPAIDFTTAYTIIKSARPPRTLDYTFEQFTAARDAVIENKTRIVAAFTCLTVNQLIHEVQLKRPGWNKADYVRQLWEGVLGFFHAPKKGDLGFIQYGMGEKYEDKLIEKIRIVTQEDFEHWQQKRIEETFAFRKSLENPETLEEFRTFINYKGEKNLSTEQRARFDELMTAQIGERKALEDSRKAKITAVTIGETDLLVIPSFHAKKQINIWVVRLSERVERPIFEDLRERARTLDGYYSSYRGNGAIPGFVFERQEAADLFIQIKDGDVNAAALRAAINADKAIQRAERVQEKAEAIEDRATEELQRDRLDNTERRARFATNAERRAIADIEFAKVLCEIGERTKAGTIKYLGRLSDIVQLEELYSLLSACKWAYIRKHNIREEKFEYVSEVIDFAEFPYPRICKDDHEITLLQKASEEKGKQLAAKRMLKRLQAVKGQRLVIGDGRAFEDFERIYCYSSPCLGYWDSARYRQQHLRYKRIQRLGFTTIYELRTALRELLEIDQQLGEDPAFRKVQEIREMERKFLSLNIDGFFPTPEDLCSILVEKAAIEPNDKVCEPSAGLGHLAEAIAEAHPDNPLVCIENYSPLADALKIKGFQAEHANFLNTTDRFDKFVMNPPFENMADIDHVYHAWNLLNAGGRIVAVMAGNKQGDRAKIREFAAFVEQYGSMEQNEPGAFKSAFRPTGVNTVTVILDKPKDQDTGPQSLTGPVVNAAAAILSAATIQGAFDFGERAA